MNCEQLKSSMIGWFGSEFECYRTGQQSLTATIPILKPNGDFIEIGIEGVGGDRWRISDLGDTHASLFLSGVELSDSFGRAEEFRQVVSDFHLRDIEQELVLEVSSHEIASGVVDFAQAIQTVLALQLTTQPRSVGRDFPSVVAKFLAENRASFEIPPTPIAGLTGQWKFNFSMRKNDREALIKTLTANNASQAMSTSKQSVFEINDVLQIRTSTESIVVLDDEGERETFWKPGVFRVFQGYNIETIPFVNGRDRLLDLAKRYAA